MKAARFLSSIVLPTIFLAHALVAYGQGPPAQARAGEVIPDQFIVVLEPEASQSDFLFQHGLSPFHRYSVINGFAVRMAGERAANLAFDPRVKYLVPDVTVSIVAPLVKGKKPQPPPPPPQPAQVTPTGVHRIYADLNGTTASTIKVAIIDTGIDKDHPDLTVAGGRNFTPGRPGQYDDGHGHGTHVAGIVGAKNNDIGVRGVAPGVQLYAVRVLDSTGSGTLSGVIAGVDWAASQGMDVANMSLGAQWWDTNDPLCDAVDSAVFSGVTVVVAAGNEADYADVYTPAHCGNAITVSAIVDSDGQPRGLGGPTDYGDDDTFATFTNFGQLVDIAAPGVNILSTWLGSTYETLSGTSMASPHVAGAAALFIQYFRNTYNSSPLVSQVTTALVNSGFPQLEDAPGGYGVSQDPDRFWCELWTELDIPEYAAMSCGAYEPLVDAGGPWQ